MQKTNLKDILKIMRNFSGENYSYIPHSWFSRIVDKKGYTSPNACLVLSEVVYWYRPIEIEKDGKMILRSKFAEDCLQKQYQYFMDIFNLSKRQVIHAFQVLEDLGLIKREFRNKNKLSNLMYIHINPNLIIDITEEVTKEIYEEVEVEVEVEETKTECNSKKQAEETSDTLHTYSTQKREKRYKNMNIPENNQSPKTEDEIKKISLMQKIMHRRFDDLDTNDEISDRFINALCDATCDISLHKGLMRLTKSKLFKLVKRVKYALSKKLNPNKDSYIKTSLMTELKALM